MDDSKEVVRGSFEAFGGINHFTATHYLFLTPDQIKNYFLQEGQFLVHLWFEGHERTFKIFKDESDPFAWATDSSSVIIDKESVEVIGSIIDAYYD